MIIDMEHSHCIKLLFVRENSTDISCLQSSCAADRVIKCPQSLSYCSHLVPLDVSLYVYSETQSNLRRLLQRVGNGNNISSSLPTSIAVKLYSI